MKKDFIKKASLSEIEILAKLANKLWTGHSVEELKIEFSDIMQKNQSAFFVKYVEEQPVGFAQCQKRFDYVEGTHSSPVGYLEGVYVCPKYRRQGFATQLLKECENWAKENGCKEFASDCQLCNYKSAKFHLVSGFKEANRIICFTKKLLD
ncbi:MAG: aminoglycoside 6'-N-acetyltransferase [Candidatus Caccovivens sp.]